MGSDLCSTVTHCRHSFTRAIISLTALTALISCWILTGVSTRAGTYAPDHPEVLAMVDRGIGFLEKADYRLVNGEYAGGHILVGYTVYKVTADKDHRLVKRGIEEAVRCASDAVNRPEANHKIVYDAAVAAIFLADVDAALYRPQLLQIRDFFRAAQKRHGGFGYLQAANQEGDTSQTQYAMLAMWALSRNNVEIPSDMSEACLRYMIITQEKTGGWGYQTKFNSGNYTGTDQVTKSLATAGICATLIGADLVGLLGKRTFVEDDPDVPKAFTRIDLASKERDKKSSSSIKLDDIRPSIERAVAWQKSNNYQGQGARGWYYYYRYSEERYESFLEVMNGKGKEKSPPWYDAGVAELKKLQGADGGWGAASQNDFCPPEVCTAFAILYLIRSTQKTIAKLNEGLGIGGYGLPKDARSIKRVGDKIVSEETASVEGLLELMEKTGGEKVEVGLLPDDLALAKDPAARKTQVNRLSRLLRSKEWKARRIAAKLLGRSEDVNMVPDLIYALTDPDSEVPMIAEESLRLLTRKLTVRHLEVDPKPEEKEEAARYWRQWYISVRPDYVFLDK